MDGEQNGGWEDLSEREKKIRLYLKQKKLLDTFLAHQAITKAQYDKSLGDLTEKMGMQDLADTRKE